MHIFFIGFMGVGKTTIAQNISDVLNEPMLDLDDVIVKRANRPITQIFKEVGEDGFRQQETEALKTCLNKEPCIISCGGGIVEREKNVKLMRSMGYVVYLESSLENALGHITEKDSRPMLSSLDENKKLFEKRLPLYQKAAHIVVNVEGLSIQKATDKVVDVITREIR